jgi:hypothetical protein
MKLMQVVLLLEAETLPGLCHQQMLPGNRHMLHPVTLF